MTYLQWRKIARECARENSFPDMNYQGQSLFHYKRRDNIQIEGNIDRNQRDLIDNVSIELDLNFVQARELVTLVREWNPSASLFEFCEVHYGDRSAVLRTLANTIKDKIGDPKALSHLVLEVLDDLKKSPDDTTRKIAGANAPRKPDLRREWAAQKIKEEAMLLEALRHSSLDYPSLQNVIRIYTREQPKSNNAINELPTLVLRKKEQLRLDRAWLSVILPMLVAHHSLSSEFNLSPFVSSNPTLPQLEGIVRKLCEVFAPDAIPFPDEKERASLRCYMDKLLVDVKFDTLPDHLLDDIEILCAIGFGSKESQACDEFWDMGFPGLRKALEYAMERGRFWFFAQLSFGETTRIESRNCIESCEWKNCDGRVPLLVWDQYALYSRDIRFEPMTTYAGLRVRIVYQQAHLAELDENGRQDLTRVLIRYILTATKDKRHQVMADSLCTVAIACLADLCKASPSCQEIVITTNQSAERSEGDIRNVLLSECISRSEHVLLNVLAFCDQLLESTEKKYPVAFEQFKRDCANAATKTIRRHRRVALYENIISEDYDVETSVNAILILKRLQYCTLEDADILVELLRSSSERLAVAAQAALTDIDPMFWASRVLTNNAALIYLFKVSSETNAALLENLALVKDATSSILGLLGPDVIKFARKQVFDCICSGDIHMIGFLLNIAPLEPDLVWSFLVDQSIVDCLVDVLDQKYFTDYLPFLTKVMELMETLLTSPVFDGMTSRWPDSLWGRLENISRGTNNMLYDDNVIENMGDDDTEAYTYSLLITRSRAYALTILGSNFDRVTEKEAADIAAILPFTGLYQRFPNDEKVLMTFLKILTAWSKFASHLVDRVAFKMKDLHKISSCLEKCLEQTTDEMGTAIALQLVHVLSLVLLNEKNGDMRVKNNSEVVLSIVNSIVGSLRILSRNSVFLRHNSALVVELCSVFVLATSLFPEWSDHSDNSRLTKSITNTRLSGDAATTTDLSFLLPFACEVLVSNVNNSGLVLFAQCCEFKPNNGTDYFLLRDAFLSLISVLNTKATDNGDLAKLILLCLAKASRTHADLLVGLGLIKVLALKELSFESIQLASIILRDSPSLATIKDFTEFFREKSSEFVRILSQFRSSTSPLTTDKLKLCYMAVRLIRELDLVDIRDQYILTECWRLITDLVEGGPESSLRNVVGMLEEFTEHVSYQLVNSTPRQMARLVLRTAVITSADQSLHANPIVDANFEEQEDFARDTSFSEPGSPPSQPFGVTLHAQWPVIGQSSPRAHRNKVPSVAGSTQVTRLHLRITGIIAQILTEIFLLLNSGKAVDLGQTVLFDLRSSSQTGTRDGPDSSTLISALVWIRRSLRMKVFSGEDVRQLAKLACVISFTLYMSMRISLQRAPLPSNDPTRIAIEQMQKRLFGDKNNEEDHSLFATLVKRLHERHEERSSEIVQDISTRLEKVFKPPSDKTTTSGM